MPKSTQTDSNVTIGIDVGDRKCHVIVLDSAGDVVEDTKIATTKCAFERRFKRESAARIALEVGTHSPWLSRLLTELGHEVIVANARKLHLITKSDSKNDRTDAELLARLARVDPKLLSPIEHRPEEVQTDRSVLKARHCLVRARVGIINAVGCQYSAGPTERAHFPRVEAPGQRRRGAPLAASLLPSAP